MRRLNPLRSIPDGRATSLEKGIIQNKKEEDPFQTNCKKAKMLFYFLMDSLAGFLTRDRSGEEAADFKVMSCFSKNLVKSMHVCPATY